ncbi:hypothetical protein HanPSC8_Chr10g0410541 [Helianthus annuus]|nr:hypothetical protein HanPSC8_Chr10g0410541 [Helianthus annuus]
MFQCLRKYLRDIFVLFSNVDNQKFNYFSHSWPMHGIMRNNLWGKMLLHYKP